MATGLTSTAIDRAPGPSRNFVRGKSGYVPFWPGGLDALKVSDDVVEFEQGSSQLRTIAPGLSRGLNLATEEINTDVVSFTSARRKGKETDVLVNALFTQCTKVFPYHHVQNGYVYDARDEGEDGGVPLANGVSDIDDLLPTSVSIFPSQGAADPDV